MPLLLHPFWQTATSFSRVAHFEQWVAHLPEYACCTGRGYVVAMKPATGEIAWKYDVGEKPERLSTIVTIKDDWGDFVFTHGPATSTVWSTPSYDPITNTIFFGTDTNNAPRQPTADDERLDNKYACAVIAIDATNGLEKWSRKSTRGMSGDAACGPTIPRRAAIAINRLVTRRRSTRLNTMGGRKR